MPTIGQFPAANTATGADIAVWQDNITRRLPSSLLTAVPAGAKAFPIPLIAAAAVFGRRTLMVGPNGGVVHSDPTSLNYSFAGFANQSVASGAALTADFAGIVDNTGDWTWTPGAALYVGALGILTHTVPTTGVLHRLAVALSPTSILIVNETPARL